MPAVRAVVDELHQRNVTVLWPYLQWDKGTRPNANASMQNWTDAQMTAWLLNATDADGINGDSLVFIPEDMYAVSATLGRPPALEAEGGGTVESQARKSIYWFSAENLLEDTDGLGRLPFLMGTTQSRSVLLAL